MAPHGRQFSFRMILPSFAESDSVLHPGSIAFGVDIGYPPMLWHMWQGIAIN